VTTLARQQSAPTASNAEQADDQDDTVDARTAEARSSSIHAFPAHHSTSSATAREVARPRSIAPFVIGALLIIAALVAWFMFKGSDAPAPGEDGKVTGPLELAQIDVSVAQPRVLARSLPLSGSLAPVVQATVKSKVGGEVEQLTVREGQDVRQGDVIARLDTRNLQAQYDRELAAVDKARADLELATLNREKNRSLLQQKYISQNTFEQTESAWAGSVANLRLAEAQARLAKINLDDAVVRAPFAGTVARRLVQPGEKVAPDTSLVALVDLRELLLEAAVPAAEIPAVKIGQAAHFSVGGFGKREFEGKVQRINPITADGSRSIMIYVSVLNPDLALKGGMFAQGNLLLDVNEPVLSIPGSAVKSEAGVPIVYVLENGKLGRRQVTVGEQVEGSEFVAVQAGLQQGDRVIVPDVGEHQSGDAAFVRGETAPTG